MLTGTSSAEQWQSCLDFVELFPVLPVQGSLACWMLSPLTMWGRSGTSFSRGVASRGGGCSAIISWDHSWTPAHLHLLQNKKRGSDLALPSFNHSLFVWQTQLCQLRMFPVHPNSLILSWFSLVTPFTAAINVFFPKLSPWIISHECWNWDLSAASTQQRNLHLYSNLFLNLHFKFLHCFHSRPQALG